MVPSSSELVKSALQGLAAKVRISKVVDAIQNTVTGIGTSRSKTHMGRYVADPLLTVYELESLFESNDLAAVIVGKIVEDALRAGFHLERKGGSPPKDKERAEKILEAYKVLEAPDLVSKGATWGRLFGDGGLVLGVSGGGTLETPLDDTKVTKVEFLLEWDRQDMTPVKWDSLGDAEVFTWAPPSTGGVSRPAVDIHRSRLLWFSGALTTSRGRTRNQGWNQSVLQRVHNALKSFDQMFASTDAMFADASQAVFKLQGLIQTLAEGSGTGSMDVSARLQLMDLMRSAARAVVLDAGDEQGNGEESFEVVDRTTLGTLDKVIDKYYVRLAASARMPLTVLLGMSPAGMDATGESDMILYFNTVDVYRQSMLQPRIERLVRMVARSVGDQDPDSWTVCWPELARPKPLDVATAENMRITSAVALATAFVVTPEEIALNLPEISTRGIAGLKIDTAPREKALKDAMLEVENRELGVEEDPAGVAPTEKKSERKTPSKAAGKQV